MAAIGLPNDKRCSISTYCRAWRTLKTLPPEAEVKGWEWYPVPARDILRRLHEGLHDRINRHDPRYGRGRKWDQRYQIGQRRDARRVNEYSSRRLVEPCMQLETPELQRRFRWNYTRDGLEIRLFNPGPANRSLRRAA
jgi:hypothetical protein